MVSGFRFQVSGCEPVTSNQYQVTKLIDWHTGTTVNIKKLVNKFKPKYFGNF